MALSLVPVTGRIVLPNDTAYTGGILDFTLSSTDTELQQALPTGTLSVTLTGTDIPAAFQLWRNTSGVAGSNYKVQLRATVEVNPLIPGTTIRKTFLLGYIQVGVAASYTIGALLANPVSPTSSWNLNIQDAATGRTALGLGALAVQNTVNLSTQATGTMQAAQEPAHTGDVTNTAGSLAMTIAPNVVTNAKLATMAANSIKGNNTAGAAGPFDLTTAQVKTLLAITTADVAGLGSIVGTTGTKAQFNTAVTDGDFVFVGDITSYTDEQAQDAVGAMIDGTFAYVDATPLLSRAALTGAVTAAQGSNVTAISANAVTLANMAQVATASILGRATGGVGNVEALTAATAKGVLAITTADVSGLGALATLSTVNLSTQATGTLQAAQAPVYTGDVSTSGLTTTILADAVTNTKLANVATATLKGRVTAGTGDPEDLTATQAKALLNIAVGDISGLGPFATASTVSLSTQATGVLQAAQEPAHTGDVTNSAGSLAMTIAAGVVSNAKLATVPTATLKGRTTAGTGAPEDMTVAQAKNMLAYVGADVGMTGGGTAQDYAGFATRAAFVTWASGKTPATGAVIRAVGFSYRYIASGTAIADLPGWIPLDDAYPDHWGQNTTPGTTDMAAAGQSLLDAGYSMSLGRVPYYITTAWLVKSNGQQIVGPQPTGGAESLRGAQIIINPASTGAAVIFASATPDTAAISHAGIHNVRITGGGNTARTGYAIECRNCDAFSAGGLRWDGFYRALRLAGGQLYRISNILGQSPGGSTLVAGTAAIKIEPWQKADLSYIDTYSIELSKLQIAGGGSLGTEFLIDAVYADGLHVSDSYFGRAGTAILQLSLPVYKNIAATEFSNCYFDQVQQGPCCLKVPTGTPAAGGGNGKISANFANCFFSGSTSKVIDCDNTVALTYLKFANCDFKAFSGSLGIVNGGKHVAFAACRFSDAATGLTLSNMTSLSVSGVNVNAIAGGAGVTISGTITNLAYDGLSFEACPGGNMSVTATGWDTYPNEQWFTPPASYTPVLSFGGTTVAAATAVGKWYKIGKMVRFTATIILTSKGVATGNVKVTVPIPCVASSIDYVQEVGIQNVLSTIALYRFWAKTVSGDVNNVTLVRSVSGGTAAVVIDSDITNTTEIRITGEYEAA